VPYLNDPRRRITLNFHPDAYDALAADAARAGHAAPSAYALALVQARGAALRPVVDERGAQRVAQLHGKLAAVREALATARAALADCRAARAQEADERRALARALANRPTAAEYEQQLAAAVQEAVAALVVRAEASPALPPTPEQEARAQRRAAAKLSPTRFRSEV